MIFSINAIKLSQSIDEEEERSPGPMRRGVAYDTDRFPDSCRSDESEHQGDEHQPIDRREGSLETIGPGQEMPLRDSQRHENGTDRETQNEVARGTLLDRRHQRPRIENSGEDRDQDHGDEQPQPPLRAIAASKT